MADTLTVASVSHDPRAEALFGQWNIAFELKEILIDEVRLLDGAQVRDVANIAPSEGVEEYATQMRSGANFPPVVLMKPNILIDGNTRLEAARRNGRSLFPAYVVEVPTVDFAKAVAGGLNQLNGRRLTSAEAQRVALTMVEQLHWNDEQVAAYVGRTSQMVRTWRRQAETEIKAKRLGLGDQVGHISKNQQDVIAGVVHDAPFAELVKLAADVKVPRKELSRIVKEIGKAPSEVDEIQVVTSARTQMVPVGPPPRRAQRNLAAHRARMVIPQLLNLKPLEVLEPARFEEDHKLWHALRDHVDAVLVAFDEHPPQEPFL